MKRYLLAVVLLAVGCSHKPITQAVPPAPPPTVQPVPAPSQPAAVSKAETAPVPAVTQPPPATTTTTGVPDCPLRCIPNTGAPLYVRCFWGSDFTPPFPPETNAWYNNKGERLDTQTVNGQRCAFNYSKWNGLLW